MIFNRIIPSLLLKNFRLVKGKNFQNYIDAGDPVKTIKAYCDQGADEIILSIIDNKKFDYKNLLNEVNKACNVPLCIYGNIKTVEDAQFYFRNGADKVGITSYGLKDDHIFSKLSKIFGSEAITATLNYKEDTKKIFNYKTKALEGEGEGEKEREK
jgi:cyclase